MQYRSMGVSFGIAAVLLLALVAGFPWRAATVPVAAQAAQTWEVAALPDFPEEQLTLNAFAPNALTIAQGDSVRWTLTGAHTVTFLGARGRAADLPQFVAGGPFPDGRIMGAGFSPIGPEGAYDGDAVRSSGRLVTREDESYTLTFAQTGAYAYLCLVHPGMNGTVMVLATGAILAETPAQAHARGQADGDALLASIRAGTQAVRLASATAPTGAGAHSVAAGISNGSGGSALQFLPAALTVRRGDFVAWVLADPLEAHTITFTSGEPAPEFAEVVPQANGSLVVAQKAETYRPVGGTTYTGQGYLNSGQLFGGARGALAFVARIDAPSGTYEYQCLLHREMKGTVTVAE